MKYYKLGYRKHFKFVVRANVGISTVKSFYSPSRWWAKLAIRWRLYKLNIVRSSDMVALYIKTIKFILQQIDLASLHFVLKGIESLPQTLIF